jgi:hypothetical protein
MRIFGKTSTLIAGILAACCAVGAIVAYRAYENKAQEVVELQAKVAQLTKQEKQSAIMQSINAQMEEIALQERRVSDEQRDAAEQQTKVAEQMRRNAEEERQNAFEAEHRALEASEVAKSQRAIAEQQRSEAEHSKRMADTLSYITLARQLGNVALTQHQAGNREIADLLAYAAYLYTDRYHSDVYYPTIYQALEQTSQSRHQWNRHKGTVTDIAFTDDSKERFVTCSSYGELLKHSLSGKQLKTDTILSNRNYDFRDIYIIRENKIIYCISRTGHLVIYHNKQAVIREINGIGPLIAIQPADEQMFIIGEHGIAQLDTKSQQIIKQRKLAFKTVFVTRYDYAPVIFDNKSRMHIVRSMDKIETLRLPVSGQVTAFASSKKTGLKAYGMKNGTIYLFDTKGKRQELISHRSQISFIKINGWLLYSSSYDGTLNLWMTNTTKVEPMTILKTGNWITCFTFDTPKHNIWCGDQKGNLTEEFIAVDLMVERIKSKLKRNLTREEWDYYLGRNVPYETFIGKEAAK